MREDRSKNHSMPLSSQTTTQSPGGYFQVPNKEEQLARALAKQQEVMLAKINAERETYDNAKALKTEERRHISAMRRVREEAVEVMRHSSSKRESRRSKVLETAAKLKAKEDQAYFAWRRSLKAAEQSKVGERINRTTEIISRTLSDSPTSLNRSVMTAQRQRQIEEVRLKKQESEQTFITDSLKLYEKKMQHHDSLHKLAVKTITDKVMAKVQRIKEVAKTIETIREISGIVKAKRLIEKHQNSSKRKTVIDRSRLQQASEHKRSYSDKRRQVLSRVSRAEEEVRSKSQVLEHRMNVSTKVLQTRFNTWNKELTVRHELAKLKNEDTLETAERHRRIAGIRRMQILDKHFKDTQRIRELKHARNLMSSQSRDIQVKTNQERQKLRSALGQVSKSPESARTKEIIRELEGRGLSK